MGNHHSHERTGQEGGSRRGTEPELEPEPAPEPTPQPMVPVEKLGKILAQRAREEEKINAVTQQVFIHYLFPKYSLGARLFDYFRHQAKAKQRHLTPQAFRQQAERLLAMLDDEGIVETYVKMFNPEEDECPVTREGLRELLLVSYKLSMDHYPDGPQACFMVEKTLGAVVESCIGRRSRLATGAAVRWLREHCPRLVLPVHRYVVHVITTAHRSLAAQQAAPDSSLGLASPVLEGAPWTGAPWTSEHLLTISASWLIAAAAPPSYSLPHAMPHPGGVTSSSWVSRLVCLVPVHWTPLYASRDHGLGANRFLHHVTSYRGPTIMLMQGLDVTQGRDVLLVVACPMEWHESQNYWGGNDGALLQLYPTFSVVERGPKLLYLNTTRRGAARGLRAGSDPKKPLLSVNEDFDKFTYRDQEHPIACIEVWGCGDTASREAQLDIKRWQVKEAERQRQVKLSAADWIEHPDRYLLELAGRPQYNNSAS